MIDIPATFIFFFAVIDPIGTLPVFLSVTQGLETHVKRRIALKATSTSAIILIFFVVAGEIILTTIGIPLSAFQTAGGIILFLFALTMIFGPSKPEEELKLISHEEKAIYPLAIPSIASPGAILAAVLLTENYRYNLWEQIQTTIVMLFVLLMTLLLMLGANRIHRLISNTGASVISRVMGLILASVAVNSILAGIKDYFTIN